MRISAAQGVCVVSDGGCLGGSPVDLVAQADLLGYVRVSTRPHPVGTGLGFVNSVWINAAGAVWLLMLC